MRLCCFHMPGHGTHFGVEDQGSVYDLTALATSPADPRFSVGNWMAWASESGTHISALVGSALDQQSSPLTWAELDREPSAEHAYLAAPLEAQEVWGAGVTYRQSREARERESASRAVYAKVYDAERPELFFKATPHRCCGPNDWIGVRADSAWTVPEPELAIVLSPTLKLIGFTICNDVTARDTEGENPLYLPQAKTYSHSCALGPAIVLAADIPDWKQLTIGCRILRQGKTVFEAQTETRRMKRTLEELVGYLGRANTFPQGVILATGTGIVPPDDVALKGGDVVEIAVEPIGVLRNSVRVVE